MIQKGNNTKIQSVNIRITLCGPKGLVEAAHNDILDVASNYGEDVIPVGLFYNRRDDKLSKKLEIKLKSTSKLNSDVLSDNIKLNDVELKVEIESQRSY